MNSTLGKYAPITAAVTGVGVIGAYLLGVLLGIPAAERLLPLATLAFGAIFGSAVVANGHKEPMRQAAVANARLDALGVPSVPTEIVTCPYPGCWLALDHPEQHRDRHGTVIDSDPTP